MSVLFSEQNPYFGKTKKFDDLPHLILVPGTVLNQWEAEAKVLLRPKSFDILMYGIGKGVHEVFWSAEGDFRLSKHKPRHRIIIASHSVRWRFSFSIPFFLMSFLSRHWDKMVAYCFLRKSRTTFPGTSPLVYLPMVLALAARCLDKNTYQ